jgi:alpha-1,2-mannosyltransferase
MIKKVSSKEESFNNDRSISESNFKTTIKIWYYYFFGLLYKFTGKFADLVIVNSSWTKEHIQKMWGLNDNQVTLIYPPCDTTSLMTFPLYPRDDLLISIAQFRPEKNHILQIQAFDNFVKRSPTKYSTIKFVMIGSVRDGQKEDEEILSKVETLIKQKNLQNQIIVRKNITDEEKRMWLRRAMVGVHTMSQEHFGIGIVEFMASGVIPIAHNSGGPQRDIVVPRDNRPTGYLAKTADEYANCMEEIFQKTPNERSEIQLNARLSVQRFSDETFCEKILHAFNQKFRCLF